MSVQLCCSPKQSPLSVSAKPASHLQLNDPSVFWQDPLLQMPGCSLHSSASKINQLKNFCIIHAFKNTANFDWEWSLKSAQWAVGRGNMTVISNLSQLVSLYLSIHHDQWWVWILESNYMWSFHHHWCSSRSHTDQVVHDIRWCLAKTKRPNPLTIVIHCYSIRAGKYSY